MINESEEGDAGGLQDRCQFLGGRLMVRCYVGKAVNAARLRRWLLHTGTWQEGGNDAGYGNQKCIGWMGARIV